MSHDDRERTRYDAQDAADAVIADLRAQLAAARYALDWSANCLEAVLHHHKKGKSQEGTTTNLVAYEQAHKRAKEVLAETETVTVITSGNSTAAALATAPEGEDGAGGGA